MDEGFDKRAAECLPRVADWTAIGRRIVRAAAMATAVRVVEVEKESGDRRQETEVRGRGTVD
jgi:hypothetical protein